MDLTNECLKIHCRKLTEQSRTDKLHCSLCNVDIAKRSADANSVASLNS